MAGWQTGIIIHGIGRPERILPPEEPPFWISEAEFERLLDAITDLPDPDSLRITFDDSNMSDHAIALPHLARRGLRADFFVLTGRIGQPGSLGAAEIRDLQAAGMTIGSHGIDHVNWRRLGRDALARELGASRTELEAICGHEVRAAAVPFGLYDGRVLAAAREAGYGAVYTSDRGRMRRGAFLRPRGCIMSGMDGAEVRALLTGDLPLWRRARRMAGMLRRRLPI